MEATQTKPEINEAPARRPDGAAQGDAEAHRFGRPPENLPSLEPAPPTRMTDHAGVQIEVIDLASKKDRARFLDMAAAIYDGDPNYVAPLRVHMMKFLDPRQNPAFEPLEVRPILAIQNGKIVGRMTAQTDQNYDAQHDTKAGFFGFFECINDRKVAHAMLDSSTKWLASRGVEEMFGPTNFTTNHTAGLLVENFDRPAFVEETYNPRYYEELFTSFGFGKAKDLLAWWIDVENGMESKSRQRIQRIAERVRKREGVTVRHIDMSRLDEELDRTFELYVRAWEKNWGFVPLSKREFMYLTKDLKDVAIPELVLFVECQGKVVGFASTLPNVNAVLPKDGRLFPFGWTKLFGVKKVKEARLYTLGMLPEYRKRGLEALMFTETVTRARKLGIRGGEIGWTLEDNDLINRAIEAMEGHIDRRYRILGLKLSD